MKSNLVATITRAKGLCLALALITSFAASSNAQVLGEKPWTTVGVAGTVSPTDTNDVAYFGGGWVGLTSTASSARINYNVVAVDGLLESGIQLTRARLTVKFLDNGPNAHVRATLKEFPLNNTLGFGSTLMTLNSDNYPADDQFQTQSVSCSFPPFTFDFVNNAYFIEVEIDRPAGSNGKVGLAVMQLGMTTAPCITGSN